MKNIRHFLVVLGVSLACALFATGCDDIISDPNFHTWCGDQLCSWKLESGGIRKAPTWHKNDTGVELLDSDAPSHITAISQVVSAGRIAISQAVDRSTRTCFEFSIIADVAAEAQVYVEADFGADGTPESEQQIAAVGFRVQKTQVTAPPHFSGMKFTIAKRGSGRAVIAQMDVKRVSTCTALPVTLRKQAIGTQCALLFADQSGLSYDHQACSSGVCCEGLCSECCVSQDPPHEADGGLAPDPANECSGGAACGRLGLASLSNVGDALRGFSNAIPRQCSPGHGERPRNAECLIDDDCSSHVCEGETWSVVNYRDGGACAAPPTPDPSCNVSSVHGGHCR